MYGWEYYSSVRQLGGYYVSRLYKAELCRACREMKPSVIDGKSTSTVQLWSSSNDLVSATAGKKAGTEKGEKPTQ